MASDLRDGRPQKKHRGKSKAKHQSTLEVTEARHYFPSKIAEYLANFVEPTAPTEAAKAKEYFSRNKRIDDELMKRFKDAMLPKLEESGLLHNPSKLESKISTIQGIKYLKLDRESAERATAQAELVQKMHFGHGYTAFARLFYRCFRDWKNRQIWNDTKNSAQFKEYLKQQCGSDDVNQPLNDDTSPYQEFDGSDHDNRNTLDDPERKQSNDDGDGIRKQVIQWLEQRVNLPQYIESFTKNDIDDMNLVKMLDDKRLKQMGILSVGHRMRIMDQISALQQAKK